MKKLASIIGLLIAGFGLFGILAPARLLTMAQSWLSPAGLYGVAAARVLAGLILLGGASQTRFPAALRILGGLFVLNGIITALLGLQRAEALLVWASGQSSAVIRLGAAIALGVGGFIAYAASGPGRAVRQAATS